MTRTNSDSATTSVLSQAGIPNGEVTITRIFDAPRDLVFRVWTDPRHVARWWGPTWFTNPLCEMDVRPGGAILIHMADPDGVVYPMKGMFREIVEPERLVFTSSAFHDEDGTPLFEAVNTITFEEEGSKTKVTVQAVIINAKPGAEGPLSGMEEGWNQSFGKLADLLAEIRA